jgi:hypothetical protein
MILFIIDQNYIFDLFIYKINEFVIYSFLMFVVHPKTVKFTEVMLIYSPKHQIFNPILNNSFF